MNHRRLMSRRHGLIRRRRPTEGHEETPYCYLFVPETTWIFIEFEGGLRL